MNRSNNNEKYDARNKKKWKRISIKYLKSFSFRYIVCMCVCWMSKNFLVKQVEINKMIKIYSWSMVNLWLVNKVLQHFWEHIIKYLRMKLLVSKRDFHAHKVLSFSSINTKHLLREMSQRCRILRLYFWCNRFSLQDFLLLIFLTIPDSILLWYFIYIFNQKHISNAAFTKYQLLLFMVAVWKDIDFFVLLLSEFTI